MSRSGENILPPPPQRNIITKQEFLHLLLKGGGTERERELEKVKRVTWNLLVLLPATGVADVADLTTKPNHTPGILNLVIAR